VSIYIFFLQGTPLRFLQCCSPENSLSSAEYGSRLNRAGKYTFLPSCLPCMHISPPHYIKYRFTVQHTVLCTTTTVRVLIRLGQVSHSNHKDPSLLQGVDNKVVIIPSANAYTAKSTRGGWGGGQCYQIFFSTFTIKQFHPTSNFFPNSKWSLSILCNFNNSLHL